MNTSETKIYIIRHGETLWNTTLRFQWHTDVLLSDKGHEQAQLLADKWSEPLDAIYSSDLSRAVQTGQYLADKQNLKIVTAPQIKELCFGHWEGLTSAEIAQKWPNELDTFFYDPGNCNPPGGESFTQVYERAVPFYQQILDKHRGGQIAIFTHGGTSRMLLCFLLGMSVSHAWNMRQDNTCVNSALHILTPNNKPRTFLEKFNDTYHLIK